MRKGERIFIYTGLSAAILLGLGWRGPGVPAYANEAARPQAEGMKLASVDMLKIVEKLVKSEKYAPSRDAYNRELTTKLEEMAASLQSLQAQIQASPQNSPETQGLIQNFQQRRQEFEQSRQEAAARSDEFNARQIAEAYQIVTQTIDALAQKGGYTHVLASRSGAPVLKSSNIAGAVQEMLARPLVKGEPTDDLTKAAMDELKLPDIDDAPTDATPAPAPGNATPAATPK